MVVFAQLHLETKHDGLLEEHGSIQEVSQSVFHHCGIWEEESLLVEHERVQVTDFPIHLLNDDQD